MKEFTLNANAWHFRLANYGQTRIDDYDVEYGMDICTYVRAVLRGLLSVLFTVVITVGLTAWVGYSIYDIYQIIAGGPKEVSPGTAIFVAVIAAIIIAGTMAVLGVTVREATYRYRDYSRDKQTTCKENQPGFIKLAYRKFKDKTCFKIKFED